MMLNFDTGIDLCHSLNMTQIDAAIAQIILVEPQADIHAQVYLCEKNRDNWQRSSSASSFPAVVGTQGIAGPDEKREGDLKTPAGFYPIGETFGTEALAVKMDYKFITPDDKFIDDLNHPNYNQWVSGKTNAASYETMLQPLYKYGAVIQYNSAPTMPGLGSAIFLHIWHSANIGTAGCIALQEKNVLNILHWLDKNKHPHIKILPLS